MANGGKPSPSDLAALEHAFASDPASDAYQPLAEAYLALGRFMEAMVVCKKGVKAHPDDAAARVLLARVYADQGKDRKAQDELKGALGLDAAHPGANRLLGEILLNQGEMDAGTEHLKKAADGAPDDPAVKEALHKWGIDYTPAAAVPPPPPEPAAPPPPPPEAVAPAAPQAPAPQAAPAAPPPAAPPAQGGIPTPAPMPAAPQPPAQPQAGIPTPAPMPAAPAPAPAQPQAGIPTPPPAAPVQPPPPAAAPPPSIYQSSAAAAPMDDGLDDVIEPRPSGKGGMITTLGLLGVGVLAIVGWVYWTSHSKAQAIEIDRLLKDTQEQLARDSYASYRAAAQKAQSILEIDPDQFAAHAYLAYISVLRWGEHGEGDTYRDQAKSHLESAHKAQREHSHLIAADAYFKFFGNDQRGAIDLLEGVLERPDVASGLLAGTLGHLLMWSGDLEGANKYLMRAQQQSPGNPRLYAALAELSRRRGSERRAWEYYDQALRFDPEHVDSLLGKSLIILDSETLKPDDADALIEKVLKLPPDAVSPRQQAMAHFAKAQMLYAKGKDEDARSEQERALMLQPNNPDIHLMIGRRHFRKGEYDQAATAIRKAIQIEPKRAGFYVQLARVLLARKGGAGEAVEALEKARATLPDNAYLLVLLGDAQTERNKWDEALSAYGKAIEMKEGFYPDAQLAIGAMWRERKDYDKALTELGKALDQYKKKVDPRGQAKASLELARVHLVKGDDDKGKELLGQAAQTDPSYADTYYFLGRFFAAKRAKKEAAEMLEAYLKMAPHGPWADQARDVAKRL